MDNEQTFEYSLGVAKVSGEEIQKGAREIWDEMKAPGSLAYQDLQKLGLKPEDLPADLDSALSFETDAVGYDLATISLVVATIGGAIAPKLPGMIGDVWKYVILPQLRARWGDKALAEKAKKTAGKGGA